MGLFSFAIGLLTLSVPLFSLQVFDRVLSTRSLDTLIALSIGALLSIILLMALEVVRRRLSVRLGQVIEQRLLQNHRQAFGPGPLADLKALQGFLGTGQPFVLFDFPWAAVYAALLFVFHPLLGCVVLAGIVLAMVLSAWKVRTAAAASGATSGTPTGPATVLPAARAMAMASTLSRRTWHQAKAGRLLNPGRMDKDGIITGLQKGCRFLVQIALVGIGAALAINGDVTIGMMVAANILGARALTPAEGAIEAWSSYGGVRDGLKRLAAHSRRQGPIPNTLTPGAKGIDLSVRDLVHPDSRGRGLLYKGFSFQVAPGEQIGLTGPSGGGKSLLAHLIMGLGVPRAGQIRVGGLDPATLDDQTREALFGFVPQAPELYAGTVGENIARMNPARLGDAQSAALFAGVNDLLTSLEDGYNTRITGPESLSSGEVYAVQMARALLGPPRLLVLDEPAAFLDAGLAASFTALLDRLRKLGVSVILISQRRSLLRRMDRVVVLTDGEISQQTPAPSASGRLPDQGAGNVLPISSGRLEGQG